MTKAGFTLIELLVALAISSIIAMVLFNGFYITNRTVQSVDTAVDFSMRATLAFEQIERDLVSAFIPDQGRIPKKAQAAEKEKNTQEQTKKPARQPLKKVFYGTVKNEQLDTVSLIANNIMQPYWSASVGKVKPKIARVVYTLVPDATVKNKPVFSLMRQEGYDLDFNAYSAQSPSPIRAYELIGGIKKLTFKYTAEIEKETVEKKEKEEIKTIEKEYKVFDTWDSDKASEKQEGQAQQKMIPYAVDVELTLWDMHKKQERRYATKILMIAEQQQFEEKPKESASEKKEKAQAQQKEQEQGNQQKLQELMPGNKQPSLPFALRVPTPKMQQKSPMSVLMQSIQPTKGSSS